jgi:hypothetical protein
VAEIKLELPDLASTAMGKAVLAALGKEGEEKIVQACISYLTKTPDRNSYYGGSSVPVSPLMDIVFQQAREISRSFLREKLEKDEEFKAAVEKLYLDATRKFFGDGIGSEMREKLIDSMARRLSEAFERDR